MPDVLCSATEPHGPAAWIDRVDPRARIVAAAAFSVVVMAADRLDVLDVAIGASLAGLACCGLSWRLVLRRLLAINVVMALLLLLLPLSTDGTALVDHGPLRYLSREGLRLGSVITLKGNAVVLMLLALLGSIEASAIGHALAHLRVPRKLTHLLLFTVRYLDVLHRESLRLRAAMRVRGFRPRMDRRTYRAYGYLVGMLLVRSFDRSERIAAAMRCRGFHGRFYLLDHFAFSRRDVPFSLVGLAVLLTLVFMEWVR